MYRRLYGNLRLWTIQELVSSFKTKAYRMKQEISQYEYLLYLSSSERYGRDEESTDY